MTNVIKIKHYQTI